MYLHRCAFTLMFLTQQCLFLSNQDGMMIHESSNITPPTPLMLDYQSNNQLKQLPMSPVFYFNMYKKQCFVGGKCGPFDPTPFSSMA